MKSSFRVTPPVELSERFWEALESLRRLRWVSTYEWLRQHRRILAEELPRNPPGCLRRKLPIRYLFPHHRGRSLRGPPTVAPREIGQVWGVIKAYAARVRGRAVSNRDYRGARRLAARAGRRTRLYHRPPAPLRLA